MWNSLLKLAALAALFSSWSTLSISLVLIGLLLGSFMQGSPVGEGRKTLTVGHYLKVFSTIQGKTMARHFCNFSSEAVQLL